MFFLWYFPGRICSTLAACFSWDISITSSRVTHRSSCCLTLELLNSPLFVLCIVPRPAQLYMKSVSFVMHLPLLFYHQIMTQCSLALMPQLLPVYCETHLLLWGSVWWCVSKNRLTPWEKGRLLPSYLFHFEYKRIVSLGNYLSSFVVHSLP